MRALKDRRDSPISGNIDSDDFSSMKGGAFSNNLFVGFIRYLVGLYSHALNMEKVGGSIRSTMEKKVEEEAKNIPKIAIELLKVNLVSVNNKGVVFDSNITWKDTLVKTKTDSIKAMKKNDSTNNVKRKKAYEKWKN